MAKTIRLLIIDDNEDDYFLTCDLLGKVRNSDYQVDWATSGGDGLGAMLRKSYDICLVNDIVGASTGIEFIRLSEQAGIGVPVIILTQKDDLAADREAQKAGAAEFLVKEDLTARLLDRSIRYAIERADSLARFRDAGRFLQSTLDALAIEIAIVDESGAINFVNQAWTDFAFANGLVCESWKGTNYLAVCDRATAAGDTVAGEVAQAIREVLDRRWSSFNIEYPCHGGGEQRWFRATVTRFRHMQSTWAVVAHENITDRKLAESPEIGSLSLDELLTSPVRFLPARNGALM
jgi:FixJ family two-component response regulator